ncbi:MAG: lasso peptide biosynthesis B2 protein [Candidatus Sulfopaludibacter sp.]|nr:lasso peptide biosynthesis B2 protein [Candidatus Sulfopaludibacter sp.]
MLGRPRREDAAFAQALGATIAVRVLLAGLPVRSVRRVLRRVLSANQPLPVRKRISMDRLLRCAARASRLSPVGSTCLVSALVAEALLNRHGYPVTLRVGAQRLAGAFAAHAWLEFEGCVVVGGPLAVVEQYTPFPEIDRLLT